MRSDGSATAAQYRTDENDARNWQSMTGNANASTPDTAPPPRARRIAHTSRMTPHDARIPTRTRPRGKRRLNAPHNAPDGQHGTTDEIMT